MISALPVSPMVCRWVVNWNISTVILSPMPWPAATKYPNDRDSHVVTASLIPYPADKWAILMGAGGCES